MKKSQLNTYHEIEIHYKRPSLKTMPVLGNTEKTIEFIKTHFEQNRIDLKEFFWVILMTSQSSVLGYSKVNSGTLTATLINIREIIQLALLTNAARIILVHNHPSGIPKPSNPDHFYTQKCLTVLKYLELKLDDHIIITSEGYYSFMEEAQL